MYRASRFLAVTLFVFACIGLAFASGYATGARSAPGAPVAAAVAPDAGRGLEVFGIFWEAWDIVKRVHVDRKTLEDKKLTDGAIKGLVDSLNDSHSWVMDAQAYGVERTGLAGAFDGIGATVMMDNRQITIVSPIDGSPAARAGLKPGDKITSIDGESTAKMSLTEAVAKIRGPRGTMVKLAILRLGEQKPFTIEIVRDEIKVASVKWQLLDDGIGYLRINQFTDRTLEETVGALKNLQQSQAKRLVLDLRHNPGGLLSSVVEVTSQFLKSGVILYQVDGDGQRTTYDVRPGGIATDIPMVVITDKGTASASEILSGALQDTGRAQVVGGETFGKGSVTQIHQLSDGSALNVVIARWLTPKGHLIEGKGISPDVEVEAGTDDDIVKADPEHDVQLRRAIEVLKSASS